MGGLRRVGGDSHGGWLTLFVVVLSALVLAVLLYYVLVLLGSLPDPLPAL